MVVDIANEEVDNRHHEDEDDHDHDPFRDIPCEVVASTTELGQKLMGSLDPHSVLRVQRQRKKKKKKRAQLKSYVKGKVVDGRHELYALSVAVMLGVRASIARTSAAIAASKGNNRNATATLSSSYFLAEEKYEFAHKVRKIRPGARFVCICAAASCCHFAHRFFLFLSAIADSDAPEKAAISKIVQV